ncbi:MarR family winged helix-turn-helix transcriptional regulator [Amycolatopsis sp. CA-230715]|uniref:MarR family winged helix-turn-helix transcriptional regulator n=1 Tax=Amycolatopsis sp. CA-230715 TaxID=2745196 RepID=UPI001C337959|nr:MarR family transcriptional regulator [Amycolatopsis sp. CA-230715]QWF82418.1 Transcriptional regulator SlyA [Amycolatopsis sp. CA-230715]
MTSIPLRARTIELWGAHNPGLDTAPMELVAQVKRISALLDLAVEPIYDGAAVTAAEVGLLVPLRHLGEPVTAIRLAARLGMSRAGVSKTLAKLERRGLISRVVNPADRRAALISMTDEGKALVDDVFPRELAAHGELLSGLGKDRARVLDVLTGLAEGMEARLGGER